jgi:hypothetical protein
MVGVRIDFSEAVLRSRVKAAGGIWRPRRRLWELDWKTVRALGLQARAADDASA